MSLKSLKATKKRKTRKPGFEDNKKEAGKHSKRGQSQFSTLVVYPLYKKAETWTPIPDDFTQYTFEVFYSGGNVTDVEISGKVTGSDISLGGM